jgi:hypothetical protein
MDQLRLSGRALYLPAVKPIAALLLSLGVTLGSVALLGQPQRAEGAGAFLATFDGTPGAPTPWQTSTWDITTHSRATDRFYTLDSMHAGHGADCAAPPATHLISSYDDAVFQCRNHIMTSINAGEYGLIYLTPNQLVDFSAGEAVVRFEMSTLTTSTRDWPDLWITPYNDNVQLALDSWLPDGNGEPRNSVHVRLQNNTPQVVVSRDFDWEVLDGAQWWVPWDTIITPSAATRSMFELRISRTHIKFGVVGMNPLDPRNTAGLSEFWWFDGDIPALSWNTGVLQLGHHSYNPEKPCDYNGTCGPATWHWDSVSINPATPFTMLRADRRFVDKNTSAQLNFAGPAPSGARLRFLGVGANLQVSYDGGGSWQNPQLQALSPAKSLDEASFRSYWTPVPAGTSSVRFRGNDWCCGPWLIRDASIWASSAPTFVPPPPPAPTPTVAPTAAPATPVPTVVPTVAPTLAPTVAPTAAPTVGPTAQPTIGATAQPTIGPTAPPTSAPIATAVPTAPPPAATQPPQSGGQAPAQTNQPAATQPSSGATAGPVSVAEPVATTGSAQGPSATAAPALGSSGTTPPLVAAGSVAASEFHSRWVDQSADLTLEPGATGTFTVRFRNVGTAPWVRGVLGQQAGLGIVGDGEALMADWPSADRVAVQNEAVVAPGEIGTFTFNAKAPAKLGIYALGLRPVIDGITWLEDEGVHFTMTVQLDATTERLRSALALITDPAYMVAMGVMALLFTLLFAARRLIRRRAG